MQRKRTVIAPTGVARRARALFAVTLAAATAFGEQRDPTIPQVVIVGPPPGAAPMARIDARRSGRSRTPLPVGAARIRWRLRLSGLIRDVAIGDRGAVATATIDGSLVAVSAIGRFQWTRRLGAAVLAGPVLTSNGAHIVVTADGGVVAVGPNGSAQWTRSISAQSSLSAPSPLPDDDGGVIVAFGDRLVRLEQDGEISAAATVSEPVRCLTGGGSIYAVSDVGSVFRWSPPDAPTLIGRYSAAPSGEVTYANGSLVAVINHQRLESLSVDSGARRVLAESALSDNIVVLPSGSEVAVAGLDGMLIRLNLSSSTIATAPIPSGPSSFGKPSAAATMLLAISDPAGNVAVSGSKGLAMLDDKGPAAWLELPDCGEPVALLPHSAGRVVVACQSGLLMLIGSA